MKALQHLRAKFAGICAKCRERIRPNQLIGYDAQSKQCYCASCASNVEAARERGER